MSENILKGCVKEVRSYAKTLGFTLTQSQAYEFVARARGFQSANILAVQPVHDTSSVEKVDPAQPLTMNYSHQASR